MISSFCASRSEDNPTNRMTQTCLFTNADFNFGSAFLLCRANDAGNVGLSDVGRAVRYWLNIIFPRHCGNCAPISCYSRPASAEPGAHWRGFRSGRFVAERKAAQ